MRKFTRAATLTGVSMVALGGLLAGVAGAQGSSYKAQATADALKIELLGQRITASGAIANVDGLPHHAKAEAGETLVNDLSAGTATAEQTQGQPSATSPCEGGQLAPIRNAVTGVPGVARLDITCGTATAAVTDTGSAARGVGAEVVLEPSVSGLLSAVQLQDPAKGAAKSIEDAINPLVEGLTATPVGELVGDANATLKEVIEKVLTLKSTARIVVAPASADAVANADSVTATACGQGVRIELLPVDELGATNGLLPDDLKSGEPLVTITVGSAYASKTTSRNGGPVKGEAAAALATIHLASTPLVDALGLRDLIVGTTDSSTEGTPVDPIVAAGRCTTGLGGSAGDAGGTGGAGTDSGGTTLVVPVGSSQCILEGTPLAACVKAASASVDAEGNAAADGATISLFDGQVSLTTGRAEAGNTVTSEEARAGAPGSAPSLPRTGGTSDLAILGAGLMAAAIASRRLVWR